MVSLILFEFKRSKKSDEKKLKKFKKNFLRGDDAKWWFWLNREFYFTYPCQI